MRLPEEVRVVVCSGEDRPLKLEEDGYIGTLRANETIELHAFLPANRAQQLRAINVDGQKNVVWKKAPLATSSDVLYTHQVRIMAGKDRNPPYVAYPHNNFRLVEFLSAGQIRLWEVALVAQNGEFFLSGQPTYLFQAHRFGQRMVIPGLDKWPQLEELLISALQPQLEKLPELKAPVPQKEDVSPSPLASGMGVVLWYNIAQGMGAIQTHEGPARVHWSQVVKDSGRLACLAEGQRVKYVALRSPKASVRGTSFEREAIGVSVVA